MGKQGNNTLQVRQEYFLKSTLCIRVFQRREGMDPKLDVQMIDSRGAWESQAARHDVSSLLDFLISVLY